LIEDASIGLAWGKSTLLELIGLGKLAPKMVAAKVQIGRGAIIGLEDYFQADVRNVEVGVNFSFTTKGLPYSLLAIPFLPTLNFSSIEGGGLDILAGLTPVRLDYKAITVEAKIGLIQGAAYGLEFSGSGLLSIKLGEKFITEPGLLNGDRQEISGLGLVFAIDHAVGFRGIFLNDDGSLNTDPTTRYWQDTDNNNVIDQYDTPNPNGVGFALNDFSFAVLALQSFETGATYITIQGDLSSAGLVGIPGVTANIKGLSFGVNVAIGGAVNPNPAMAIAKKVMVTMLKPVINTIIVQVNELTGSFADNVGAASSALNDAALDTVDQVIEGAQDAVDQLKVDLAAAADEALDAAEQAVADGITAVRRLPQEGKTFIDPNGDIVDELGNKLEGFIENASGQVVNAAGNIVANAAGAFKDGIATAATGLLDNGKKAIGNGANKIANAAGNAGSDALNYAGNVASDLADQYKDVADIDNIAQAALDLFLPPAIDYSVSGEDGGQYGIKTGRINSQTGEPDPLEINLNGTEIFLRGLIELNVFDVVTADLAVDINVSLTGITMFGSGEFKIVVGGVEVVQQKAVGLLAIKDGIAFSFTLEKSLDLGPLIKFDGDLIYHRY
ncbi:hypothetical protein MJH12_04575, partial [bacterium]|nr:hypothetical protein [bacterium]